MSELKYPDQLTPAHWAKNKGALAKAKPTGVGEALVKLQKAHDDLDLSLFDTAKLKTAEAVAKVLAIYETEAKKKFIKAFEEAKKVEDVASDAVTLLKKSALIPKSAREAAEAVAQAASDYAVALSSARQTGVNALQKLQEMLEKSEAKSKGGDDEDDENAPAQVIAERVARKLVVALKVVKANQGDPGKPAQRFLVGVNKAVCGLYMGPRAGNSQKALLKAMLPTEGGTLKFHEGECLWEREAYTFVGDSLPAGGFARRLQKTLLEATGKKLKVRVRQGSGEVEEVDDQESTIPEAPPLPTGGTTIPPTRPPSGGESGSAELVKQRLKLLTPRLDKMQQLPGQPSADALRLREAIKLKLSAKDFDAVIELLEELDQLAARHGVAGETATRTPIDPRDELRKETLQKQIQDVLDSVLGKANSISGSPAPKYKMAYLQQHQKMLLQMQALQTLDAGEANHKKRTTLLGRAQAVETRLIAAVKDPADEKKKEELLDQVQVVLDSILSKANSIGGTPKYKAAYLDQHKKMVDEKSGLEELAPRVANDKKLANLLSRAQTVEARVTTAAVKGPEAQNNLDTWGSARVTTLENSIKPPAFNDELRGFMVPVIRAMRTRIAQAQRLIDGGEFAKAVTIAGSIYHEVDRATVRTSEFDAQSPAYFVERDKALLAIAALKRHVKKDAIAAEIQAIEAQLDQIDCVITEDKGWTKAAKALALIEKQCAIALQLANRLKATDDQLPDLNRRLTDSGDDPATATRRAAYAHKLLVEENCSSEDAVQMARDVDDYMAGGLSERDALVSARVNKAMKDAGIAPAKAKLLGKILRASGSSTADDAKAVAKVASRMSEQVIENLLANGIPIESFRGGVTEVDHSSIGEPPRGWGGGKTWDHVPGMYNNTLRKVLVGTMDDGGNRKVPAKNEVSGQVDGIDISHAADDLVGHEAGHGFDVSDGDTKNKNADFRAARLRDIASGNLVKRAVPVPPPTIPPTPKPQPEASALGMFVTRDNYFVVKAEPGVDETNATSGSQADLDAACSETFAESFAMHFAGSSRWPELEKFWQSNPWGV